MDKLISTVVPTTKRSWAAPRSPDVPQDYDPRTVVQGNSAPYLGERLAGETSDSPGYYRDMLPAAPRAQDLTEPSQTKRYSKFMQNRYKRGNLYFLSSPNQNIMSIVDGGPSNANWVRGNQFSNNYSYKNIWGRKKVELNPLQEEPKTMANVVPSPFYPFPTFFDRNDRLYKTYPDNRSSYFGFLPFYTFPHRTVNNKDRSPKENTQQTKPGLVMAEHFSNKEEHFADMITKPISFCTVIIIMLLIAVLFMYSHKLMR